MLINQMWEFIVFLLQCCLVLIIFIVILALIQQIGNMFKLAIIKRKIKKLTKKGE